MKRIFRIFALLYLLLFALLGLLFIFGILDVGLVTKYYGKISAALALLLLVTSSGFFLIPDQVNIQSKDDPPSHLR